MGAAMTISLPFHPRSLTIMVAVILAMSLGAGRAVNPVGLLTPFTLAEPAIRAFSGPR